MGQTFRTEPKALAVVGQDFQGRGGAIAKDIDGAFERVVTQALATHSGEPIDSFSKVNGLGGNEEPALGTELEHESRSKNVRTSSRSSGMP